MTLNFPEYPYKFVKVLKSQQLIEKDTVTLACEIDDASGEVQWWKGDEEVKPDKRIKVVKEGRKRKLVISDAKVTDAGQYRCTTNADKTEAEIVINCKYENQYILWSGKRGVKRREFQPAREVFLRARNRNFD